MVKSSKNNRKKIIRIATKTILTELKAVKQQLNHIDSNFIKAVEVINNCKGRIVVIGIGKSGLIGKKIVATFSSIGVPSIFVHPTEIMHGDLGMIVSGDIILILSYSGETEEIKKIFPAIKNMNLYIILITGRKNSVLSKMCNIVLNVKIQKEACPFNLVPTSSTTAMLVIGDALAMAVSGIRGFRKEDYAKFHPGGTIGKKLFLTVKELMHTGKENPVIYQNKTVKEALIVMTKTKFGCTSVINEKGCVVGCFTDGDLRRKLQFNSNLLDKKLSEVMTVNPKTITEDKLAYEASEMMQKFNCDNLIVVNKNNHPIGIIDERDLILAGIK